MFGNYSKLIGALAGNIVGIILVWAAAQGFGTCEVVNGEQSCVILGFSQAQITAAVLTVMNMSFVHWFPANKPN